MTGAHRELAVERFAMEELQRFAAEVLRRAGAEEDEAALTAASLAAADLRGVHTHGVIRTEVYAARLRAGSIVPGARLTLLRDDGPVAVADAAFGLGPAMAARAMDLAIARAARYGVGVVGVVRGSHCGMLAWPAMRALEHGMIGVVMSNADAQVAPWGARARFLGTNPLAVAVPAGQEAPIVLDMATSAVPHARIQAAAARGERLGAGWALDADGRPTTDPVAALAGALLPVGGAKGSGLALIVDILAGILPGGRSGPEITPLYERLDEPQGVGHLVMALAVERFTPLAAFRQRVDSLIAAVRALPTAEGHTRVYLPGEVEHERALAYRRRGIPLPPEVVQTLTRLAAETGVPAPSPLRLDVEAAPAAGGPPWKEGSGGA